MSQFALDVQGLDRLRYSAARNPEKELRAAAEQFEALFLNKMMQSMRDATPRSDLTDSSQMKFYESLFDQQVAQHMAGRGVGLADQLVAQLSKGDQGKGGQDASITRADAESDPLAGMARGEPRVLTGSGSMDNEMNSADAGDRAANAGANAAPAAPYPGVARHAPPSGDVPRDFVHRLEGSARAASQRSGMPAPLILAQAALETGWGRHEIRTGDGGNSHNLFGIKAGADWRGPTTEVVTHEYLNGERVRVSERFRVYDSYEEAFADHGRLIGENPRYAAVAGAADPRQAARAMQDSGYATDPAYADKLVTLIDQIDGMAP